MFFKYEFYTVTAYLSVGRMNGEIILFNISSSICVKATLIFAKKDIKVLCFALLCFALLCFVCVCVCVCEMPKHPDAHIYQSHTRT